MIPKRSPGTAGRLYRCVRLGCGRVFDLGMGRRRRPRPFFIRGGGFQSSRCDVVAGFPTEPHIFVAGLLTEPLSPAEGLPALRRPSVELVERVGRPFHNTG
jgi:hypothetical protein